MTDIRPDQRLSSDVRPANSLVATDLGASLTASDLATSAAWYRDVLGFAIDRVFERDGVQFAARLTAGPIALLLTQDDGAKGRDRAKGEGISLQITTRQNIDELAARAKAQGVTLDTEPMDAWGARVFRLRDPDGFKLVVSSERPPNDNPQRAAKG